MLEAPPVLTIATLLISWTPECILTRIDSRSCHEAIASSSYAISKAESPAGPNSSDAEQKLDPGVDSDLDNRRATSKKPSFM